MPYEVKKVSEKCWEVHNTETGEVHAKCTSKAKAMAQMRLLQGVAHGWKPTGGPGRGTSWREYWSAAVKGKKFGSRAEVNAYMKEMGAKYRASKK